MMQLNLDPYILIDENEKIMKIDHEQVKLYKLKEVYVVEKLQGEKWVKTIQTDMIPRTEKELSLFLLKLARCPKSIGIRDEKTLISKITVTGNQNLFWTSSTNNSNMTYFEEEKGVFFKKEILIADAYKLLDKFGISKVKETEFKKFCSTSPLPKPLKRWSITFPMNTIELERMEENLVFQSEKKTKNTLKL